LHDEPYTAAVVVKTMLEARSLVAGYSFWTFTDIFEENFMPATAFQGGFGLLTLQGVAKPAYRAFELLHRLGAELLAVTGKHTTVDAWAVRGRGAVVIIFTNHALPRHAIATHSVHFSLKSALRPVKMDVARIDDTHANAKRCWIELGRPTHPLPQQVEEMNVASRLVREPLPWAFEAGEIHFQLSIPPHGVAAITIEFSCDDCQPFARS
jgi:xylan 1,4-beta-xylosidase